MEGLFPVLDDSTWTQTFVNSDTSADRQHGHRCQVQGLFGTSTVLGISMYREIELPEQPLDLSSIPFLDVETEDREVTLIL